METKKQQLIERETYTPTDTSLVCSPATVSLNKEETLSEHGLKTSVNNLEENLQSCKTERNMSVFVINLRNKPLMPCTPTKARHLLKQNKARVINADGSIEE